MFSSKSEQFNPDQNSENVVISEQTPELETPENKALGKLIDFEKQKDVGVVTLGFGEESPTKDSQFISGLLNSERVLTMGLLPRALSQRAQKPISQYGFFENAGIGSDNEVRKFTYTFPLNEREWTEADEMKEMTEDDWDEIGATTKEERAKITERIKEKWINSKLNKKEVKWDLEEIISKLSTVTRQDDFKKWFILFDSSDISKEQNILGVNSMRGDWIRSDWGIKIPQRVKPERIKGILIDEDITQIDIQNYFKNKFDQRKECTYGAKFDIYRSECYSMDQIRNMEILCKQLGDCVTVLNPNFSEEEKVEIEKARQSILDIKDNLLNHVNTQVECRHEYLDPNLQWSTGYSEAEGEKFADKNYFIEKAKLQDELYQSNLDLAHIYFDKLSSLPDFSRLETIGQYLIQLGKKYSVPIYKLVNDTKLVDSGHKDFDGNPKYQKEYHFSVGLYWPKQMQPEQLKDYVKQHEDAV